MSTLNTNPIALLLVLIAGLSFGQGDELRKKHFNIKNTVALEGFDPTTYFDGTPMEGSPRIMYQHRGVVYHFVTQTNLNKFKATPEKFEPAYGGWCAYAMGKTGEKVKIDPETYLVLEGKLYLFYNFWGNNTLVDWKKDQNVLKEKADSNWKKTFR